MKLIIGLGNPGKKYEQTRHNCGFMAVKYLAQINNFPKFELSKKFESLISEKNKVILVMPQTFMNESGRVVKKIKDYYKIHSEDIIVIHDDIDIPLGTIKVSRKAGSAGHKGVQSIIDNLGTKDFIRYRIGIKPNKIIKIPLEDFVVGKFSATEKEIIDQSIKKLPIILPTSVRNNSA